MKDKIMTAITKMLDNPNISTPYTIYNDEECCEEIMGIINQYRVAEIKKLKDIIETVGNILYVDTDGIGDLNEARRIIKEGSKS